MKPAMLIWTLLFVCGGLYLAYRAQLSDDPLGSVYVKPSRVNSADQPIAWTMTSDTDPEREFSPARTIGLWTAAFFTLCIFSYLYRDNVFYKLAESVIVGVSAGFFLVTSFWDSIVAQLMVELAPNLTRAWALPSLDPTKQPDYTFLIPLVLSLLLFSRFVPGLGWLARWPLAFVVGTFAGLRLVLFLDADFISQIRNTIVPLIVMTDGRLNFWSSVRNVGLIVSLLSCLAYFFFSLQHQGLMGRAARLGIWVLMITFGASFAFTVMGRITLLTMRFEFLLIDCLRLIQR